MIDTLARMWLRHAELRPEAEAVRFGEASKSFGQVADRGLRLGDALRQLGLRSQDRVAVLAMNRDEWVEIYAACELAGFIATPLNARLSARELAEVVRNSSPAALIFERPYEDVVQQLTEASPILRATIALDASVAEGVLSYEALITTAEAKGPVKNVHSGDIAHLIYTSGSTGRPKGVARSHAASIILATANTLIAEMRVGGSELLVMPMFHIGAQGMAMGQHWAGGRIVLHRRFEPVEILRTIERERITVLHLAPTLVQQLIAVETIADYDLSSLETVCYAAAPMPVEVLREGLKIIGPRFVNIYGSTEVGSATVLPRAMHPSPDAPDASRRLNCIGQPTPFVDVRLVTEAGGDCPPGEVGEIHIKTAQAFSYYWNDSVATVDALRDGWYATGDMARLNEDRMLVLVDRKKDMIISGGENIYSTEVEAVLRSNPAVCDAAVVGLPDDRWGEAVTAFVVLEAGASISPEELSRFCVDHLASYKKPRQVFLLEALPRLASGKADKVALRTIGGAVSKSAS